MLIRCKFCLVFSMYFFSGCISVISPQTANTLEPGQVSAYAALTMPVLYVQSSKKKEDDSNSDSDSSKGDALEAIWIDVGTRYGLFDGLDLGIEKTNMITRFDLKKRMIGSREGFALAVGAGVGSNNLAGFVNSKKANYFIRTSDVPIYVSKKIGQTSSIYSVLRYHYTHIQVGYPSINLGTSDSSESSSSSATNLVESASEWNLADVSSRPLFYLSSI